MTEKFLDDELLSAFMGGFMGYGHFGAKTWFVGMEEGGGDTCDNVRKRICAWRRRGQRDLEDCAEYHQEIGVCHLFAEPVRLQRTWDWLIRAQLSCEGKEDGREASRAMQRDRWLRSCSGTCGIELLPLPSPGVNAWHYDRWSNNPDSL